MECKYCHGICIKKGKYNEVQKYQCKKCRKYQRSSYRQRSYSLEVVDQIKGLNNEGVGISSIGRILLIPKSSVQLLLFKLSCRVKKIVLEEANQDYEVDELYASVGNAQKTCYITYAINRRTRQVIDFVVGARTKENIGKVIRSILALSPRRIYTDSLPVFKFLVPAGLHRTFQYRTNRIERKNLTLRTHLKRLGRKTICYSKSMVMLEACFRLYVWQ